MPASDIESVFSLKVIIYASCALLNGYFWRFVYFIYSCAFEYPVKKTAACPVSVRWREMFALC